MFFLFRNPSPQVFSQKFFHSAVKFQAIYFVLETMPFVFFEDVNDIDSLFFEGSDDFIRFLLLHARVAAALSDEQRNLNLIRVENWRGLLQ